MAIELNKLSDLKCITLATIMSIVMRRENVKKYKSMTLIDFDEFFLKYFAPFISRIVSIELNCFSMFFTNLSFVSSIELFVS